MRITKDQKIAGIAAIGVRNVLQKVYDDSSLNDSGSRRKFIGSGLKVSSNTRHVVTASIGCTRKTRRPTPTVLPADATGTRAFALLLNSSRLSSSRASFG
jgi:hypothetical protein